MKGMKGWSELSISTIDVYKIKDIYYKKRLFCIFNKNHPYKLTIEYDEPTESMGIASGINFNRGFTTSLVKEVDLTVDITKRYKTEIEVINEIKETRMKQNKIELLKKKFASQMD